MKLATVCMAALALCLLSCGPGDEGLLDSGVAGDGNRKDGEPADLASDLPVGDFGPAPGSSFDRFCKGTPWYAKTTAAKVEKLGGKYAGFYEQAGGSPFSAWTHST